MRFLPLLHVNVLNDVDLLAYIFPNDDTESDRLDLQYEALKMLHDNKIYFAPLKDPRRILDIGTGTGIWSIEMGKYSEPNLLCAVFCA